MKPKNAAIVATIILISYTIFQFLLIFGLPIGHYAWGGKNEVLPTSLRIASMFSIIIYIFISLILLNKAKVINNIKSVGFLSTASWIITVYFVLGILMNAMSQSKAERINAPISLALAILCFIISRSKISNNAASRKVA